jgi:hypothetical protein
MTNAVVCDVTVAAGGAHCVFPVLRRPCSRAGRIPFRFDGAALEVLAAGTVVMYV